MLLEVQHAACRAPTGAADTNDKGEEPQAGCSWLVGWYGILAWCEGLLEEAVRRTPTAPREVAVCWCAM